MEIDLEDLKCCANCKNFVKTTNLLETTKDDIDYFSCIIKRIDSSDFPRDSQCKFWEYGGWKSSIEN